MYRMKSHKGFTLVELAIVLIIIGLLVGAGAGLIGPLTKRAKLIETRDALKQAREAFVGYAVKNGYLPASSGYSLYTPDSAFDTVGVRGVDAWAKPIRYVVASELAGSGKNLCAANATTLTLTDRGQIKVNIAFMFVSGGLNYNIQTNTTIYEQDSPNSDDFTTDMNRPEPYDDIVEYVSLNELKQQKGCPQELDILAPLTLPTAIEDTYYSYQFQATGGYAPYTWSVSSNPNYLTINASSGLLGGVINYNSTSSTGELTECTASIPGLQVSVQDSSSPPSSKTKAFTIPVAPQPLKIVTDSLPIGYEGSTYSATLFGTGGKQPTYSWSQTSGSLPAGLNLSTSGIISGTITSDSNCSQPPPSNFTVRLDDGCGQTAYKGFVIVVNDPDCLNPSAASCATCGFYDKLGICNQTCKKKCEPAECGEIACFKCPD